MYSFLHTQTVFNDAIGAVGDEHKVDKKIDFNYGAKTILYRITFVDIIVTDVPNIYGHNKQKETIIENFWLHDTGNIYVGMAHSQVDFFIRGLVHSCTAF